MEKCLQELSKSIGDTTPCKPKKLLMLSESCRPSSIWVGSTGKEIETSGLPSQKTEFFIDFEIEQPNRTFTICRIQHVKDFLLSLKAFQWIL